jgi:hypothetical protein
MYSLQFQSETVDRSFLAGSFRRETTGAVRRYSLKTLIPAFISTFFEKVCGHYPCFSQSISMENLFSNSLAGFRDRLPIAIDALSSLGDNLEPSRMHKRISSFFGQCRVIISYASRFVDREQPRRALFRD